MLRALAIVLVLASSSASSQTIVDDLRDIDPTLAKQIAADVAENFADPIATQIRRLHRSPSHADSICGQVNTKNQYGGYVGFKPFRYLTERRKVYFENTGCE